MFKKLQVQRKKNIKILLGEFGGFHGYETDPCLKLNREFIFREKKNGTLSSKVAQASKFRQQAHVRKQFFVITENLKLIQWVWSKTPFFPLHLYNVEKHSTEQTKNLTPISWSLPHKPRMYPLITSPNTFLHCLMESIAVSKSTCFCILLLYNWAEYLSKILLMHIYMYYLMCTYMHAYNNCSLCCSHSVLTCFPFMNYADSAFDRAKIWDFLSPWRAVFMKGALSQIAGRLWKLQKLWRAGKYPFLQRKFLLYLSAILF